MGGIYTKNPNQLVVSTVNYSGILLSPFQFYSEDYYKEEEALSKCFKQLLPYHVKNYDPLNFKWKIGKIDVKFQKDRYTPIYQQKAGVQKGRLLNQQQFRQTWRQYFKNGKLKINFQASEQEAANMQDFDVLCYKAIILFLYKQKQLEKAPKLNPQPYIAFMKKYYSKSFLNQQKKQKMALNGMKLSNVDVYFFQQATDRWIKLLESTAQYRTFKTAQTSAVVLKKKSFKKIYDVNQIFSLFTQQFRNGLNWNQDTIYCFADNFIFISFHLSSKKQKNAVQKQQMMNDLKKLSLHFPMCHIIAGGDANCFVDSIPSHFSIFPRKKDEITTMKKRTWLQPQIHKADQLTAEVKDCLISTLKFHKQRITTLPGVPSKQVKYLPNMEHPCDHFVVTVNIATDQK